MEATMSDERTRIDLHPRDEAPAPPATVALPTDVEEAIRAQVKAWRLRDALSMSAWVEYQRVYTSLIHNRGESGR